MVTILEHLLLKKVLEAAGSVKTTTNKQKLHAHIYNFMVKK